MYDFTSIEANPEIRFGWYLRPSREMSEAQIRIHRLLEHQFGLIGGGVFMPHATIKGFFRSDATVAEIIAAFDAAVIVSNDSDLLPPIQFVKGELGKLVGILNPQKHPSVVLAATAHFVKNIRPGVLRNSQFPATLTDAKGSFTKPARW